MTVFRFVLLAAWIILLVVSAVAVQKLGMDGGNIFFTDFSHPWRAQFNTDFSIHLFLMAAWIAYREPQRLLGAALAVLSVVGGGAISLPYILVASYSAKGDVRTLLLGRDA